MNILRKIDNLGRLVVPKSLRDQLDWKVGDQIEVFVQEDGVFLRKHEVYPIRDRVRRLRKIAIEQKASIVVLEHLDRILDYLEDEP